MKKVIDWNNDQEQPKKTRKTTAKQAPSATPASDKTGFIQGYFMPIGWDSEERVLQYYFYVSSCKSIIKLAAAKMSKQNLLMLAPLEFWVERFAAGGSFDALAAADFLISLSNAIGFFSLDKVRGRGAWLDKGKVVMHAGTQLIIEGQRVPLGTNTEFIYEMRSPVKVPIESPMEVKESSRLTKMLQLLNFSTAADARLLSGWIAIAPICGVLNWRPHIWLTGTRDSGKSWLLENVINKMLGSLGINFQGNTTEMGIVQRLNNDAFAVTFDEAEGNDERSANRMQGVLSVCRSASSKDGAAQTKGSKDGKAKEYIVRSCFLLSSINPQIALDSDKRRFCVLEIAKLKNNDDFRKIESTRAEMITPDYAGRFQARMISILPVMLRSIETFVSAITAITGTKSVGDQIGTLLGGWWHTLNDEEVTYETAYIEAEAILKAIGQAESAKDSTDEERCLQLILSSEQRIESLDFTGIRTIGELVEIASSRPCATNGIKQDEANDRLKRLGLQVAVQDNIEYLYILNGSKFIKELLQKSGAAWAVSYNIVLSRMKGAIKSPVKRYSAGVSGRGVAIPLNEIFL